MKAAALVLILALVLALPVQAGVKPVPFALSVGIVGAGVADVLLTIHGTKYHGLYEKNRLWRHAFETGDYTMVWTFELVGSAVVIGVGNLLVHSKSKPARIAGYTFLAVSFLVRSYIVYRNARLNRRTG